MRAALLRNELTQNAGWISFVVFFFAFSTSLSSENGDIETSWVVCDYVDVHQVETSSMASNRTRCTATETKLQSEPRIPRKPFPCFARRTKKQCKPAVNWKSLVRFGGSSQTDLTAAAIHPMHVQMNECIRKQQPGKKRAPKWVYDWRLGIWNNCVAALLAGEAARCSAWICFPHEMEQRKKKCCLSDCTKRLIIIFCAGTRSVYHSLALMVNGLRLPFCVHCECQFRCTMWRRTKRRTHAIGDDVCGLCHPGKKNELFPDFFSPLHTNLSRIKSNAKCIYRSVRAVESVRKATGVKLKCASAVESHFCDFLKRWYHVNRAYVRQDHHSTSCTRSSIPVSSSTRRWLLILIFNMYFPICWHRIALSP